MDEESAPKRGKLKGTKHAKVDWKKARDQYEKGHKTFTDIGQLWGCDRRTVADHARREGWVNPTQIARESAPERAEAIHRAFVERNSEAILENLTKKQQAASVLLDVVLRDAKRLQDEQVTLCTRQGDQIVEEHPSLVAARLAQALARVTVIDRDLADLKGNDWRPASSGNASDSSPDADAIRAVLGEAAQEQPKRRPPRHEGEMPDRPAPVRAVLLPRKATGRADG